MDGAWLASAAFRSHTCFLEQRPDISAAATGVPDLVRQRRVFSIAIAAHNLQLAAIGSSDGTVSGRMRF